MPELDAVLEAIHHPEKMRSKEPQKATKGMVIDLTKEWDLGHYFFEIKWSDKSDGTSNYQEG